MNKVTIAVSVLALAVSGCDSGYTYQPVGPKGKRLEQWSETVEGVRFSVAPYSTLAGSSNGTMRLDVANESKKDVFVLSGQLTKPDNALAKAINAQAFDSPEGRAARTVPAGESKSVGLLVEYGGSASHTLGDVVMWVWRVQIGDTEHTLKVPMIRK